MIDSADQYSPNDIAIVGMALRVPGASNVGQFWSNLRQGVESIRDLSEAELLAAGESPARIHHPNYVRRAAELPAMEMFDADFFGLSPKEAAIMDPQHRQFLECTWEAMEDAGRTPDSSDGPVGIFAGCGMGSYFYFNVCSNAQLVDSVGMFLLRHTGNDKDFLATRASFSFDLRGPSVNVQTACSTSLVAVHMACQSLLAGECETAIAGGVTIELPHRRGYLYQDGEILSPDGHCRAFDHRAGGTVFGSGVGVVVLRRLSDALADGDIIHSIIRGTAVNNDGASKATYLAPSVTGQAEAIIEAQGLAGVSADSIQYVECHGTGTYLGDPIEIEALTQAFRQSTDKTGFCRVGSVKSNIGHLDTAAGVVSLIKATLALKHGEMPPTLGFDKPNPAIDFARSPFVVNDVLTPWPQTSAPRRAAVNSLGVGGTNAHVIIEQAPIIKTAKATAEGPELFVFAAKHRKALDRATSQLGEALAARPELSLRDASYTLFAGRKAFEHRRVIAARDRAEAIELLQSVETRRAHTHSVLEPNGGAVFLFPGGGAQHIGMARTLYSDDAAFRATVDEALDALEANAAAQIRSVWLDDTLGQDQAIALFLQPSVQLPAILIVEVAVARHWMRHGVQPSALIGHSMGENAAACIAGVMSLADAVRLVRLRGELFDTIAAGGMLSVPMAAAKLQEILPEQLDLASVNAPELCVVSGLNGDLDAFRAILSAQGVDASRVPIDIAAHSAMLDPILPRFEAFLRSIRLNAPTIPIVSNLTGTWLTEAQARDPLYWVRHLRSTVEFGRGMATLVQQANRVFIEVGPGRALSSLVKLQPGISANQVINSLPHADDATNDQLHLLTALGRAWATGLTVPLAKLWDGRGAHRVSLPTYPFLHQRYFIEPGLPSASAQHAQDAITKIADLADWGSRPSWRQSLPDFSVGADIIATSFLVFIDETGFGADLAADLRGKGHSVVTVRVGDIFAKLSSHDYVLCPEDGGEGYAGLVSGLLADGAVPAQIVHLWLLTANESHRPGSNFFTRNQEQGFYSLFHLAQALGEASSEQAVQITIVGNGMQKVDQESLPYPEKATVLGPGLVIPKEMGHVSVKLIDLQLPAQPVLQRGPFAGKAAQTIDTAALRAQLIEDFFASPSSEVLAYRNGRRWSRSYQSIPLPAGEPVGFRQKGVYLITGGLGDLALVMARQLAERFEARIVLTGRSVLPSRADWTLYLRTHPRSDRKRNAIEHLQAFEADGHSVLYVQGDVANPEDMARVIATAQANFGPLNGVLHSAGVVDDDLIALKSTGGIEAVLAPKLHGTVVLDRVLKDMAIELFVLFSSTSTDTAPAGQIDYVAANAFLNAYADAQAWRTDRKTVAVHWGVWNEVGLAARAMTVETLDSNDTTLLAEADGPLFSRWVEDGNGMRHLEGEIGPATHWVLDEHRMVSGAAVLPGTGYIEVIAQAARAYGLAENLIIEDLMFLRPLGVADGVSTTLRVTLSPVAIGYHIAVQSGNAADGFTLHAEATLRPLVQPQPSRPAPALSLTSRASDSTALPSIQDAHMRFGPRWQVLRATAFGQGEAVATLSLSGTFRGEAGVLLHPALLDIATGFAMQLAPAYAGSDVLWVPISYGMVKVYAPLSDEISSHVRLRSDTGADPGYAAFDVTITDATGRVLLDIERFMMQRLDRDSIPLAKTGSTALKPVKDNKTSSPAALQLAAQIRQGILPEEGFEALLRALASGQTQPIVSSINLDALRRNAARQTVSTGTNNMFERPDLDSDFVAPSTDIERTLAGFWSELLGVETIGVNDSFFDIGGHSLIAVRLFRMIRQTFAVDLPISVLFEAPTIAACATLIAAQASPLEISRDDAGESPAKSDIVHLVAMNTASKSGQTPFFLCAGMFGNVLNLRQLALHVGSTRPVYGLQARGLYGAQEPHRSFEEAARDYLAEIRTAQPHGPYLLGGFSGGGLIAYEMAQQLLAVGETVSTLIMLDTPLPTQPDVTILDKVLMRLQDIRRSGPAFAREWLESRRNWQAHLDRTKLALAGEGSETEFNNAKIEAAFRSALTRYEIKPYAGKVALFRPKLNIVYHLSGGKKLQEGRNAAIEDNGWGPFVAELDVQEVPGDHNGMVLEPFVRVLSSRIRRMLDEADIKPTPLQIAAE